MSSEQAKFDKKSYNHAYYSKNREHLSTNKRAYYLKNRESIKAKSLAWSKRNPTRKAAWRARNRERINAYERARYTKHPKQVFSPEERRNRKKASVRAYRRRNLEKERIRRHEWRLRNIERERVLERARKRRYMGNPEKSKKAREYIRDWLIRNPEARKLVVERRRARLKGNTIVPFTKSQWLAKVASYGGRCAYCDNGLYEHMDHVIAVANGGPHSLDNLVPACQPCNDKKGAKTWTPRSPAQITLANKQAR